MSRPSVCVYGSANMDLAVTVDRAPRLGETITGRTFEQIPGGKGLNQALAAARAGADVRMVGAVGDDAHGQRIRELLAGDGIDTSMLETASVPTGTAHVIVDSHGGNSIVVIPGANGTVELLTDRHRDAISGTDTLLLQLELPLAAVVDAARYAQAAGQRVMLTPAPAVPLPEELLRAVDVLVPNEHEATLLTGEADPAAAGRALIAAGVSLVVVTLGGRGAMCVGPSADEVVEVSGLEVPAVDTTAAGDTFAGALSVALAEGRGDLRSALRWATVAAALSVQRAGASSSMPSRAEIDAAYHERDADA